MAERLRWHHPAAVAGSSDSHSKPPRLPDECQAMAAGLKHVLNPSTGHRDGGVPGCDGGVPGLLTSWSRS